MIRALLPLLFLAGTASEAEPLRPAELPPPEYAGLQYVDSKGCMFARAGDGSEVLWIPRVSRDGVADCDNPPSGQRVPVDEGALVQPASAETTSPRDKATGGYLVAVGSFANPQYADRAEARLGEFDYRVVRGRVEGGNGSLFTVFAGPFPDAVAAMAARQRLRESGFADAMLIGP